MKTKIKGTKKYIFSTRSKDVRTATAKRYLRRKTSKQKAVIEKRHALSSQAYAAFCD